MKQTLYDPNHISIHFAHYHSRIARLNITKFCTGLVLHTQGVYKLSLSPMSPGVDVMTGKDRASMKKKHIYTVTKKYPFVTSF